MKLWLIAQNSSYRNILFSNIINRLGDSLDSILFTWLVYSMTGSAAWSAVIFGVNQGTSVLLQPLTGPIVDRQNPKRMMILSDLVRAGLVVFLLTGFLLRFLQPASLLVVTILISASEAFHMPAATTILQRVLSDSEYDRGVGLNVSASRIAVLIGAAMAGTVIAQAGIAAAMGLDLAAFALSILFTLFVRLREQEEIAEERDSYLFALRTGLQYLFQSKTLLFLCLECILINTAVVPFDALLAPIAAELYDGSAIVVSLLSITVTIGTVLGGIWYARLREERKNALLVAECGIVLGLYYIVLSYTPRLIRGELPQLIVLGGCSVIIGIALGLMITYVQVTFIRHVAPQFMGRVTAIRYSITYFFAPITAFLISFVSARLPLAVIFTGAGIFICALFGLTLLLSPKELTVHISEKSIEGISNTES